MKIFTGVEGNAVFVKFFVKKGTKYFYKVLSSFSADDVPYENGDGQKRSFRVNWRSNFGVVYISFYDEQENCLMFEDELNYETAVILRNCLTKIIRLISKNERKIKDSVKSEKVEKVK